MTVAIKQSSLFKPFGCSFNSLPFHFYIYESIPIDSKHDFCIRVTEVSDRSESRISACFRSRSVVNTYVYVRKTSSNFNIFSNCNRSYIGFVRRRNVLKMSLKCTAVVQTLHSLHCKSKMKRR